MPAVSELLRLLSRKTADNAGEALSQFLAQKVLLHPSFSDLVPVQDFHRNLFTRVEHAGIILFGRLNEEIEGEIILVMDEPSGGKLIDLAAAAGIQTSLGESTAMGLSVLKEMGNVVMGAYITALSDAVRHRITPPLLTFINGALEPVFRELIYAPYTVLKQMTRYCLQMDFEIPQERIAGVFALSLTAQSGERIQHFCQGA